MRKFLHGLGLMLFLIIRGFALWALIPFAFVAWLTVHSWAQKASLRQAACWYEQNFNGILIAGPLRLLVRPEGPLRLIGVSRMGTMTPCKLSWFAGLV